MAKLYVVLYKVNNNINKISGCGGHPIHGWSDPPTHPRKNPKWWLSYHTIIFTSNPLVDNQIKSPLYQFGFKLAYSSPKFCDFLVFVLSLYIYFFHPFIANVLIISKNPFQFHSKSTKNSEEEKVKKNKSFSCSHIMDLWSVHVKNTNLLIRNSISDKHFVSGHLKNVRVDNWKVFEIRVPKRRAFSGSGYHSLLVKAMGKKNSDNSSSSGISI